MKTTHTSLADLEELERSLIARRDELDRAIKNVRDLRGFLDASGATSSLLSKVRAPALDAAGNEGCVILESDNPAASQPLRLQQPVLDIVNKNPGFTVSQVRDELVKLHLPSRSKDLYATTSVTLIRLTKRGAIRREAQDNGPFKYYPQNQPELPVKTGESGEDRPEYTHL